VTANNTTSIEASGIFEDNALDPSLVLSTGASQETYVISMFVSGIGTPSGIDSGTGFTSFSNHDLGNQSAEIADIDTNATGGNVTVPWITTPTTDDVAIVAVAVKENSFPSVQALAPSADSVDGN